MCGGRGRERKGKLFLKKKKLNRRRQERGERLPPLRESASESRLCWWGGQRLHFRGVCPFPSAAPSCQLRRRRRRGGGDENGGRLTDSTEWRKEKNNPLSSPWFRAVYSAVGEAAVAVVPGAAAAASSSRRETNQIQVQSEINPLRKRRKKANSLLLVLLSPHTHTQGCDNKEQIQ